MVRRLWTLAGLGAVIRGLVFGGVALAADETGGLAGVWETSFGIMTLAQDQARVIGTYSCCDGVVEGTVTGEGLTFRWRDPISGAGSGRLSVQPGGQSLAGTWGKGDSADDGGSLSARRVGDTPDPAVDRSHWAVTVVQPVPTSTDGATATVRGTADLFVDNTRVLGRLAGNVTFSDGPEVAGIEVYNSLTGTLVDGHLALTWANPNDRSTGTMDLQGDGRRFTGTVRTADEADGATTTMTLERRDSGRTETLIEQAWRRHQRLWRLAAAGQPGDANRGTVPDTNWASPMTGQDPRLAAMAMLQAGDVAGAAETFARLAERYAAAGDTPRQADALAGEASALQRLGRFEDARQRYQAILALPGLDKSHSDLANLDLAMIHGRIGGGTSPKVVRAPEMALADDDPIVLKDKARDAERARDFDTAVSLYDQAIARYVAERDNVLAAAEKKGLPPSRTLLITRNTNIAMTLQWVALLELGRGRLEEAAGRLAGVVAAWRAVDGGYPAAARALGSLSTVRQRQGRLAEATAAIDEALAMVAPDTEGERWSLHGQRARVAVAAGDDATADRHFRTAIANIEQLRAGLVTDETKTAYFGTAAALYEDYAAFLFDRRGDTRAALERAEGGRGRALLDALDPSGKGLPADYTFADETASTATIPTVGTEDAIARARADRTASLIYFVTREATYAWLITPDGRLHSGRIDAGRAAITRAVQEFRTPVEFGEDPAKAEGPRQALTRLLSAPVAAALAALPDGTRLTVIPHKQLALVPFAALGEVVGDWGRRWVLTALPSLSVAATLSRRHPASGAQAAIGRGPLLAVGSPAGARALAASTMEVARAAAIFPGATVLVGPAATRQAVLEALPRHRLVVISTHTRPVTETTRGRELELELAKPEGLGRAHLRRGTLAGVGLVILSACETVAGPQVEGDELMNLARAFLVAGAERVLITLWPLEDHVGPAVVPALLAELRKGQPPAEALHRVIADYRSHGDGHRDTPLLSAWAPWVLVARHD